MQERWDAGQVGCRTGGMQDRRYAEQERCWTAREIQDRWYEGQVGCRTRGMQDRWDAEQVGCRTGVMQERWDAGQAHGYRTCGMQDRG